MPSPAKSCNICLEDTAPGAGVHVWACGAATCHACMQTYVAVELRTRRLPRCPGGTPACGHHPLGERDALAHVPAGGGSDLSRLARIAQREALTPPSERVYCSNSVCGLPLSKLLHVNSRGHNSESVCCDGCGATTCLKCSCTVEAGAAAAEHRCAHDPETAAAIEAAGYRACGQCGVVIERTQYCEKIRCPCGHVFCYGCGAPYVISRGPRGAHAARWSATCQCVLYSARMLLHRRAREVTKAARASASAAPSSDPLIEKALAAADAAAAQYVSAAANKSTPDDDLDELGNDMVQASVDVGYYFAMLFAGTRYRAAMKSHEQRPQAGVLEGAHKEMMAVVEAASALSKLQDKEKALMQEVRALDADLTEAHQTISDLQKQIQELERRLPSRGRRSKKRRLSAEVRLEDDATSKLARCDSTDAQIWGSS